MRRAAPTAARYAIRRTRQAGAMHAVRWERPETRAETAIERRLFCLWTTPDVDMSEDRKACLDSIRANSGVDVVFLTPRDVDRWILADHPLHEAYPYLSGAHKADYLRTYLMHFHGGGYTDVKRCGFEWTPYFALLEASKQWAVGYREVGAIGTPVQSLKRFWRVLIGYGSFIFAPRTPLTGEWYDTLLRKMDEKWDSLAAFPAIAPRKQPRGYPYPLEWSEVGASLFHPICFKYAARVLPALPEVDVERYL